MVNYQNGKIYKIVSDQTNKVYVGSTTKKYLSDRMGNHRSCYRDWKNGKSGYITLFEILKYDDAQIILLENCPCNSKEELHARERHYIESLECVNKNIIGRTQKEYYNDNIEKRKEYLKQNKEAITIYQKEYMKKYYKKYVNDNKEKIKARKNQKHDCPCGASYTYANKAQHERSINHHKWLENQADQ